VVVLASAKPPLFRNALKPQLVFSFILKVADWVMPKFGILKTGFDKLLIFFSVTLVLLSEPEM
jgi:hypothetical protein